MIFMMLITSPTYADKQAITEDGETVILKDDGTWFITPNAKGDLSNQVFRNATWGMSKSQVKITEKEKPKSEDDSFLVYVGKVAGMNALIIYVFVDNKLVRAKYSFIENNSNRNDNITDYNNLKKLFEKKYAKPKEDKFIWKNDLYRDNSSEWGFAVSLGHLLFYSQWETSNTVITLTLSGENHRTELVAEYYSKALEVLEGKILRKERANY